MRALTTLAQFAKNPRGLLSSVQTARSFAKGGKKPEPKKAPAPSGGGKSNEPKMVIVDPCDEREYFTDVLEQMCVPKKQMEILISNLLFADTRGILTHGLSRFPMYVAEVEEGTTCRTALPEILKETKCTAWVDGNNAFGAVVGYICMQLAISKAKQCGFGWVSTRGSNHFGVNSFYTTMAAYEKLIGIAATNSTPLMVPPNGKGNIFGTNPLSIATGCHEGYSFVLDNSMTKVARGKIEVARNKGIKIPMDWALDKNGNQTDDPNKALEASLLLPGGEHKGYALAGMLDIMGAVLSGGRHSSTIPSWTSKEKSLFDLGQVFIAINPEMFAPGFEERLMDFMDSVRDTEAINKKFPVLMPGDIETRFAKVLSREGLPFPAALMDIVNDLASKHNAPPLKFKPKK